MNIPTSTQHQSIIKSTLEIALSLVSFIEKSKEKCQALKKNLQTTLEKSTDTILTSQITITLESVNKIILKLNRAQKEIDPLVKKFKKSKTPETQLAAIRKLIKKVTKISNTDLLDSIEKLTDLADDVTDKKVKEDT